ncbi:hypothetical protein C0992_007586 [Termitomyces sp. T32_za158]|nr:hypothetical protein C0992_007586 [Termitomyces sp. T32_za158]
MRRFALADPPYFSEQSPPVKTEASASPELPSPRHSSLQHFQFKFHAPPSSSSHGSLPSTRHPSEPPALPQSHLYRFGSGSGYNPMSNQSPWSSSPGSPLLLNSASSRMINGDGKLELDSNPPTLTYMDDYDDTTELVEIPEGSNLNLGNDFESSSANNMQKQIRRRSSKACTFLGPSRKRGPPKGYIDAIEARLHQTEALLGIIMSTNDVRAQSLLRDIGKDPFAKEIINRVDNSPYGVKGRKRDGDFKPRSSQNASSSESLSALRSDSGNLDLTSTHPSNEWQDRVTAMLASLNRSEDPHSLREKSSLGALHSSQPRYVDPSCSKAKKDTEDNEFPARRIRRRIDTEEANHLNEYSHSHISGHNSSASRRRDPPLSQGSEYSHGHDSTHSSSGRRWSVSSADSLSSLSDDELDGAIGELSLNEDEQVRYHGRASGLYLLGKQERVDRRNEGGIWRFPKARVWPPIPSSSSVSTIDDEEYFNWLPNQSVQEHLIDLYFKHVHTSLPVIHKRAFYDVFRAGQDGSPRSQPSASPFNRCRRRVSVLLLFAMFSIAARYSNDTPKPPNSSIMWEAGDEYLNHAKAIMDNSYASSRPSTCQALLLLGYREIGIGAMAQAWTYIGMAIRMAQDLGLHRSADGWARAELGGRLFGDWELHERKRIWYACVILDVYVSTYIGRPLMISEKDFDTPMPGDDDPEEVEEWMPSSVPENSEMPIPVPARIISCFNASARLAGILSLIVQAIYAIRPTSSRHSEAKFLEGLLDKWYIGLPENLRYEIGSIKRQTPPPHVLTLHMQYWCAVLLLHRPFIRNALYRPRSKGLQESDDLEVRALVERSYELCAGAANHITSIATVYSQTYTLNSCANFLCYYVFTASIMHVTILTVHPADPQARMGLKRCMEVLHSVEVLWPSACRALELLCGSKDNGEASDALISTSATVRRKRSAEQVLNDNDTFRRAMPSNQSMDHNYVQLRAPYSSQYNSFAAYTTGQEIHPRPSPPPGQDPNMSSSYDRWTSETSNNSHSFGFPGTLSTSVLPQLYSTGLVDDRGSGHRTAHPNHPEHSRSSNNAGRYQQYWNDYSTFPQLGTSTPKIIAV